MTAKKTASAASKPASKDAAPMVVTGVELKRMPMEQNKPTHPFALFKGPLPKPGDVLEFTLKNGVTYRGKVSEAVESDGEVMAEFSAPLAVVPKE
ncbi:hypothetical protein TM1040_1663 [Ruegeria sp. TM1040]|uniref:hypothetical protein n=1 Tax=Ruegeria sp. (strain TM1040) TaxID=292414 RepID=UPI0000553FC1|nr:hypothetical protein [Ruegeria sp. TM1040]ABF64348.1 hypothetical protein TM1040_1615 [Ruegeria sp. TM1040]ABF64396.1 hypothetical protein TM1040_1663 [Ruegeria sp. TM1040]